MFQTDIGKATQFKKGISGNPGGRPKSRLLSDALRNRLSEVKPGDPDGKTWAEIVATNLIEIAASKLPGAVAAANEICDRLEGRAPQSIQISDLAADLHARSDQELEFYLAHNRWPDDAELAMLTPAKASA